MFTIIGGDGKPYGPVPEDQVRRWLAEGRATAETKIQRVGEEQWTRLGDLQEFAPKVQPGEAAPPAIHKTSPLPLPFMVSDKEDFLLAGRLVRLIAALIDGFLSMVFAMPGLIIIAIKLLSEGIEDFDPRTFDITQMGDGSYVLLAGLSLLMVIQFWMLTVRGQSVGKRIMGIRIVRMGSGDNPGFVRVILLRTIVPGLIGSITYLGLGLIFTLVDICFIFRSDRRCLHDHIADSCVIEDQPPS